MEIRIKVDSEQIADFCRRWGIAELALFGSVLGGEFSESSDVDVLVTFSANARIGLISLFKMEDELSRILKRQVDLVTKGGLKPQIREDVLAEAQVLYAGGFGH
jgi:predicted nucleotidyltransferase